MQRLQPTHLDLEITPRPKTAIGRGLSVGFAGWWNSWPAEPVDGWVVSDVETT